MKMSIIVDYFVGEKFAEIYETKSQASQFCIAAWTIIRTDVLSSLKGMFNKAELVYLINIHNGLLFQADVQSIPDVIIASIECSASLDGLDKKWEVDIIPFIQKIEGLSITQTYFLTEWSWLFWYNGKYNGSREYFEEYIKELL